MERNATRVGSWRRRVLGSVAVMGGMVALLCVPATVTAAATVPSPPNPPSPSSLLFPVHGQVTAADTGVALAGVCVTIHTVEGAQVLKTTTDDEGRWWTWLWQDTYELTLNPDCAGLSPYLWTGQQFPVPDAVQTVTGVNVALVRAVFITGHLTDARSGAPVANQTVRLQPSEGNDTTTDGSGAYSLKRPPGTYKVFFSCGCHPYYGAQSGYLDEWFLHQASASTAESFSLQPGQTAVADSTLTLGGRVKGRVTDAATGQSAYAVGVTIIAVSDLNNPGATTWTGCTATDGTYAIAALPTNQYYAYFGGTSSDCVGGPNYPQQYWTGSGTSPQPIDVQTYGVVTGIDKALSQ